MTEKTKFTAKRIAIDGAFVALYFILASYCSINVSMQIRISLSGLPVILCGLLFGPLDGFLVSTAGAFLEQLVSPYGLSPTSPLWMLPAIARGVFVGFAAKSLDYKPNNIQLIAITVLSCLLVTALNTGVTYIDAMIYTYSVKPFFSLVTLFRLISSILTAIIFSVAIVPSYEPLKTIIKIPVDEQGKDE